jgi:hypothetical protein
MLRLGVSLLTAIAVASVSLLTASDDLAPVRGLDVGVENCSVSIHSGKKAAQ